MGGPAAASVRFPPSIGAATRRLIAAWPCRAVVDVSTRLAVAGESRRAVGTGVAGVWSWLVVALDFDPKQPVLCEGNSQYLQPSQTGRPQSVCMHTVDMHRAVAP